MKCAIQSRRNLAEIVGGRLQPSAEHYSNGTQHVLKETEFCVAIGAFFQSSGRLMIGQNSGAGRMNSTPTCARPPLAGVKYMTRASCSSLVFGLTKRSFCPNSILACKISSAPCALNATVKASSRKGFRSGDSPQTTTGRRRDNR